MSDAMIGAGMTFQVENAAGSGVYVALAELTSMTPPSATVDQIDVTNMDSPDLTREYIGGFSDPGECSMGMNFVPGSTTDDFIFAWRLANDVRSCKITWPNAVVWTFSGFITGYEIEAPFDDKMSATLTLKVSSSTSVS